MCLKEKTIRRYNAILKKFREEKSITQEEYDFLKKQRYPVEQMKLKEYVSS